MMKIMVNMFDKAKAKNNALKESINQKDRDIYEKATCNAPYEFLKKYKQGLFLDANVAEEIEFYNESLVKDDASTSALRTIIEAPTSTATSTIDEPNPTTFKPRITYEPKEDPTNTEQDTEN